MKKPSTKTTKKSTKTVKATDAKLSAKPVAKTRAAAARKPAGRAGLSKGSAARVGTLHFIIGGLVVPLSLALIIGIIAGFVISINYPDFNYDAYIAYAETANNWGVVAAASVATAVILAWVGASASAEYLKKRYTIVEPNRAALIALYWLLLVAGMQLFADIMRMASEGGGSPWAVVALPAYGVTTVAATGFALLVFFVASRHYLSRN